MGVYIACEEEIDDDESCNCGENCAEIDDGGKLLICGTRR